MATALLGLPQGLLGGCIAAVNADKQRRPYHRNCGCALHDKSRPCPKGSPCRAQLSYPLCRGACRQGNLVAAAPASAGGGDLHRSSSESAGRPFKKTPQ
ncbi:unnamed protein product [Spirodela intermedia]|uniref:Uncharacterized protein n=2 Tax=Spirodela intermedia TaxID=51605 RepID=A0A7I8LFP2_SPIIN|nr:unnamed protein product [Spirodela intermedia]CAA6670955.1 unnamed protein product [Spirodela intermedia]CAA7408054.1 unnamed protein product [Spirodela intermedia]